MIKRGLREEVETLLADGYSPELPSLRAVGYKEVIAHLEGRLSRDEMNEEAIRNTRRYAKRQLTWFRHREKAEWIELSNKSLMSNLDRIRGH